MANSTYVIEIIEGNW